MMVYEIASFALIVVLVLVLAKSYRTNALSSQRLAAIEAAGDGIGILDEHFRLIYMNRALLELHEIADSRPYIGKHWENLYTEKGKQKIKSEVMPALHKDGYWRGESLIVTQNKRQIPTELFLTALPQGGYIGTARDISRRKMDEEEKELLHRKFVQAQKMEVMGTLTGGIAHDFNNMLTVVSANLELIKDDIPGNTVAFGAINSAERAVARGAELTHQLLAFSRKQILAPSTVQVNAIIPETIQMLQRTLGSSITVTFDGDPNLWFANLDVGQIENAVVNLCINSRDAMPYGGNIIIKTKNIPAQAPEIAYSSFIKEQDYIVIEVADNGVGMSSEVVNKVFEPFYTTKEPGKGSGLGLSMVYGFTKQSNGYIFIDSVQNEGTRISMFFPALHQKKVYI